MNDSGHCIIHQMFQGYADQTIQLLLILVLQANSSPVIFSHSTFIQFVDRVLILRFIINNVLFITIKKK